MNTEDKVLGLLEQMASDVSELKQGQSETNEQIASLDSRMASVETDVREGTHKLDVIDVTTRRIWAHLIRHDNDIEELREM